MRAGVTTRQDTHCIATHVPQVLGWLLGSSVARPTVRSASSHRESISLLKHVATVIENAVAQPPRPRPIEFTASLPSP